MILLFVAGLFSFLHAGGIDGNAKVLTVYGLLPAQDIKPSVAEEAIKYGEKKVPGKYPGTVDYYDAKNDVTVHVSEKTNAVISLRHGSVRGN